MPYFNRRKLLLNTINSISKSKLIKECEFIIVDDASDESESIDDINKLYPNLDIKLFKFTKEEKWWCCPVIPHNKAIAEATGDVIIIQCPECFHVGDVLSDIEKRIKKNDYLVYGSYALNYPDTMRLLGDIKHEPVLNPVCGFGESGGWYQHSVYRNYLFNFCAAMLRVDLLEMGGFDERFGHGTAWGDADFLLRVQRKKMNIVPIDNPFTYHQMHGAAQCQPKSNQIADGELYSLIFNTEVGFKVRNSFLHEQG